MSTVARTTSTTQGSTTPVGGGGNASGQSANEDEDGEDHTRFLMMVIFIPLAVVLVITVPFIIWLNRIRLRPRRFHVNKARTLSNYEKYKDPDSLDAEIQRLQRSSRGPVYVGVSNLPSATVTTLPKVDHRIMTLPRPEDSVIVRSRQPSYQNHVISSKEDSLNPKLSLSSRASSGGYSVPIRRDVFIPNSPPAKDKEIFLHVNDLKKATPIDDLRLALNENNYDRGLMSRSNKAFEDDTADDKPSTEQPVSDGNGEIGRKAEPLPSPQDENSDTVIYVNNLGVSIRPTAYKPDTVSAPSIERESSPAVIVPDTVDTRTSGTAVIFPGEKPDASSVLFVPK